MRNSYSDGPPTRPLRAAAWHAQLASPLIQGQLGGADSPALVRFRDIDPSIDQPAMQDNVVSIHLGGSKRVSRTRGQVCEVFDVDENSVTLMPAFEACHWKTMGPVDFAHVPLSNGHLARLAVEEFDREPGQVRLRPAVGAKDPLIASLIHALLRDVERPGAARLYRESLLLALSYNCVLRFSAIAEAEQLEPIRDRTRPVSGGLASWQQRRVVDYMWANLSEDVPLKALVGQTGLSRAQFFRAFGQSFGRSPYAYLTDLRVGRARELLGQPGLTITEIATQVGLDGPRLYLAFRKRFGISPNAFRREARQSGT